MPFGAQILIALLWMVLGTIISIPYTFLASGTFEHFFFTVFLSPPAAFLLVFIYAFSPGKYEGFRGFLWVALAYFCLPIILSAVSNIVGWLGSAEVSEGIFYLRYTSMFLLLIVGVMVLVIAEATPFLLSPFRRGS